MPLLDPLSSISTALQRSGIPTSIPSFPEGFTPSTLFSLVYPSTKEVMLGTDFEREECSEEPGVRFAPMVIPPESAFSSGDTEEGGEGGEPTYTLAMVDIDAQPQELATVRHWLVRSPFFFSICDKILMKRCR
jgi:hypothetical protein